MKQMSDDGLSAPITANMRTDFTRLLVDQTVGQALEEIRNHPTEGRIIYFYVVDPEGRLQGVIPTRRLLLSPADRPLREIMVQRVIAITQEATVLDACEFFVMHHLLAFPIIDADKRIVGVIDIEMYTHELTGLDRVERHDDMFQLIGVRLAETQQGSSLVSFRSRFPWLLTNIGGGILAAFLSKLFEAELQEVVALALFIPVVLALAESVSIQSVSLTLQVLHGETPSLRQLLNRLRREVLTGALLGLASAAVVSLVSLVWLGQPKLALVLLGGIGGGVGLAAVIGVAMPNLLRIFDRDPQVAAGPVALALSDMATLLLYFNLARWLLP